VRTRAGGRNLLYTIFFGGKFSVEKARARRCFGRQKDAAHNGHKILPRCLHTLVARRKHCVITLYSACVGVYVCTSLCPAENVSLARA